MDTLDILDTLDKVEKVGAEQGSALDPPPDQTAGPWTAAADITFVTPAKHAAVYLGVLYAHRGNRWSTALAFEREAVRALR